jgi:hypothetical protein
VPAASQPLLPVSSQREQMPHASFPGSPPLPASLLQEQPSRRTWRAQERSLVNQPLSMVQTRPAQRRRPEALVRRLAVRQAARS